MGDERGEEGAAGDAEWLWFCHVHPIASWVWCGSSSGVTPNVRGVQCQTGSWVVSRRGEGWEMRVSLTFSLRPSSWLSQHLLRYALHQGSVWPRLCKPWSHSPSTHRSPTALGCPRPRLLKWWWLYVQMLQPAWERHKMSKYSKTAGCFSLPWFLSQVTARV